MSSQLRVSAKLSVLILPFGWGKRIQQKIEPAKFTDSVDINPAKKKLLINGYINEWNTKQEDVNNKQIPNELLIIILKFYPSHNIIFAESGSKLYKQIIPYYSPTTVLLNVIFNDKMCNKVTIQFRLKTGMGIGFRFEYLYKWEEEEQPRVSD